MTGQKFMRIDRGSDIKDLKEKINNLRSKCGKLLNVNEINENGFNEDEYNKLCKEIEWNEYLLWGLTQN